MTCHTILPASFPNACVRIHELTFVDDPVEIGSGTAIRHFSHVLPEAASGAIASLGQNVMIGPDVTVGNHCKFQSNVSVYRGVTIEDGAFRRPVINPRAEIERKTEFRNIAKLETINWND